MRQEDQEVIERESISELMRRLEAGDQSAANLINNRYAERICRLAERRISQRLQARLDAEDIMQSVLWSFFRRAEKGEFQFDHSGALWRLLITITENKIRHWVKFHDADKRALGKEVNTDVHSLEHLIPSLENGGEREADRLALAVELVVEQLDEQKAKIFCLKYQEGLSSKECAEKIGCSLSSVNRVLARVVQQIRLRMERID